MTIRQTAPGVALYGPWPPATLTPGQLTCAEREQTFVTVEKGDAA